MKGGQVLTNMKVFTAIITAVSIPIFALNALGGVVSGIWLLCIGQWKLVVYGLLAGISATWLLSLAMMPAMGLILLGSKLAEKGKLSAFLALVSMASLWQYVIASIWCVAVFLAIAEHSTDKTVIPRIIWAYGVAIAPWAYMARGEDQGSGAVMMFSTCIACLVTLVLAIIGTVTRGAVMETFLGIMICGFVAQTVFVAALQRMARASA
jgi:hypothetical protein